MTLIKGFALNPELAKQAGAKGGKQSKGRTLSKEHRRKLAEAARRYQAKRRAEQH